MITRNLGLLKNIRYSTLQSHDLYHDVVINRLNTKFAVKTLTDLSYTAELERKHLVSFCLAIYSTPLLLSHISGLLDKNCYLSICSNKTNTAF